MGGRFGGRQHRRHAAVERFEERYPFVARALAENRRERLREFGGLGAADRLAEAPVPRRPFGPAERVS
jgi:hypothetical protein